MRKCPLCFAELNDSGSRCTSCGAAVDAETAVLPSRSQANTPTLRYNHPSGNKTPWTTGGQQRFVSGMLLAGRYRVVGLIGKGGMGEVYKADDLELEQTVALKLLPEQVSRDEVLLRRFRGEVRTARKVSHRNVCRVFDIGETEGLYYITMEYIDGDDLSILLRRIGRLPSDKAVEISRDICLGLAAIHRTGILHRDLKPANVIIDSNGEARITDFGIAAVESDVHGAEARVGTPAYMSPEQIDGKEVTPRSDIYSLGLVLYEIFTGRPAFEGNSVQELRIKHATTDPKSPSEIVTGIDPIIEDIIKRCLEKDPKDRPASAMQVAMSLPGGDPLRAALEAGETPSPEMVAASPKVGTLRPIIAIALLAVVFLAFGLAALTTKYSQLYSFVPLDKSTDVLRERGRELVEKYGYQQMDSYCNFDSNTNFINYLNDNVESREGWQHLATGQPAVLQFWCRTSPRPLAPLAGWRIKQDDPPESVPGMTRLRIDTKGRLIFFKGVPPRVGDSAEAPGDFDWSSVFKDAGFDIAAFESVASQWIPPNVFDERRAFSGKYPEAPDVPIRVEAAAYRGKLVYFEIVEPWTTPPGQTDPREEGAAAKIAAIIILLFYFGILLISSWLAAKNVLRGRSNIKGTIRIGLFLLAIRLVVWIFSTHHAGNFEEIGLFITGLESALYLSVFAGLMYLAFEPYMRKSAPERVVSWNRLLVGGWRDPLVGRDFLIGGAAASIMSITIILLFTVPVWLGQMPVSPGTGLPHLFGISDFLGSFSEDLSSALLTTFACSFLILFFGLLLRRKWLGTLIIFLVVMVVLILGDTENEPIPLLIASRTLLAAILVLLPARFGVLALLSALMFSTPLDWGMPLGTWYVGYFVAYAIVMLAVAIFGFCTSTSGQKLWQGSLLGDES